jgi:predicted DCC family thiol-disulfide oxidoreductase YuxK/uncharacterized membrane protein YphA (DoxX/SURF4 family)
MALLNFFKRTLSLDYRSLAMYRFFMGLIVMADVLYRLPDLTNFYTDIGLVPRSLFTSEMAMPWSFSLHLANGSFGFAALMFGIHLIFGIMLVFGYKTRWAMLGAFIMTASIHNRNWLVNNGGDDILRAILFLSIFLPLNKTFSIDSAMEKEKTEKLDANGHFSTWTLAFFFQVFAIYFVSYILKDHPIWRRDYTAIFYASRLDIFATPIGVWLRDFAIFQKIVTFFTIYLEWMGPLLLVFSGLFGRYWWGVRSAVVIMFWALHLGIILTMWIGVFPYTCLVMWSIFLPPQFWERVLGHFRKNNFGKIAIYFDGDCGFCQKGVRIIREFLLLPEVSIAAAQAYPEIYSQMQKNNSWVVVNEKGERFFHFHAMLELIKHSPLVSWTARFFAIPGILNICNRIYLWVSFHRPFMGKASQFLEYRSPRKKIKTLSHLHSAFGALILLTLIMWNLTTIKKYNFKAPFFQSMARWLHLYQEWNMFAPFPKMDNIWVEIPAILGNGSEIELLSGEKDIFSVKDKVFPGNIQNEHWRKFFLNLSERTDYARYYGGFLCRQWNDRKIRSVPNTTLRKMEIIVYSQPNLINGKKGSISRKLSWKHWCFDRDYEKDNPGSKPSP